MGTLEQIKSHEQAREIDVPKGILIYLQKRIGSQYAKVKSRYSVTDIVGCQRKTYYKTCGIEEEELLEGTTVQDMWDTVRGYFLHQMTYAYKWREMDIEYNSVEGLPTAVLAGRIDMYDWKTKTVIES